MYADLGHFSPKSIKVTHLIIYKKCNSSNSEEAGISFSSELS